VNAWVAFRDVPSMDLTIGLSPSDSIPNVGDAVTFTVKVRNSDLKTRPASPLRTRCRPASPTPPICLSQGSYNRPRACGAWERWWQGIRASLAVTGTVNAGTAARRWSPTHSSPARIRRTRMARTTSLGRESGSRAPISRCTSSANPASLLEGQTVSLSVVVSNHGPDKAEAVVVHHTPAGRPDLRQRRSGQGTYAPGAGCGPSARSRAVIRSS
jgi:hypothetical protein